ALLNMVCMYFLFFFFQAEDGIRDFHVTGVQTCALPILPENNLRQAMIPEGAEILPNRVGTAPGVYLKVHGAHVFCLPGVPGEMRAMWKEEVAPRLSRLAGGPSVILSKTLRFYGIGESALEERVNALPPVENPT